MLAGGALCGHPRIVGDREVEAGRLVRLLDDYDIPLSVPLSLLYPATSFVPPKIAAFRDFVLESIPAPGPARTRRAAAPRR